MPNLNVERLERLKLAILHEECRVSCAVAYPRVPVAYAPFRILSLSLSRSHHISRLPPLSSGLHLMTFVYHEKQVSLLCGELLTTFLFGSPRFETSVFTSHLSAQINW